MCPVRRCGRARKTSYAFATAAFARAITLARSDRGTRAGWAPIASVCVVAHIPVPTLPADARVVSAGAGGRFFPHTAPTGWRRRRGARLHLPHARPTRPSLPLSIRNTEGDEPFAGHPSPTYLITAELIPEDAVLKLRCNQGPCLLLMPSGINGVFKTHVRPCLAKQC